MRVRRAQRLAAGGDARFRLRTAFAAILLQAGLASSAAADWTAFLPHPFENHAWIETFASWENDNSRGSARSVNWNDTFVREKLLVESAGYSYDPRFLLYKLSVGGACKQEDYNRSASSTGGWQVGEAIEYDARVELLPDHDFNVQAFATRHEPVYRQQAASSHDSVANDYGVGFRYRRKPWFFNADYTDSAVDSAGNDSDVQQVTVEGEYFKRFVRGYEFSVNATVNPSWYSDSTGLDGSSTRYLFGNLVNLKQLRLSSNVSQNSFDQDRHSASSYETEQFAVWELLSLYMPWGFRSDLTYRHHDDSSKIDNEAPLADHNFSDKGDHEQLDVYHRLYQSLDTRYRLVHDTHDSSNGSTELLLNGLSLDYTKVIPHGRLLSGVNLARSDIDNSGFADVVNDPYTATAVPGTFALRQQDVDPSSIVVLLHSPLPPFDTITLVEGVNYQVNTSLQPFEIQILSLPPEFVVPGSYDFFVSYSLLTGDYELRTDTAGTNISFQLFDDIVSPYFRFLAQRSDVMSGTYPGVPLDSNNYVAGLRLLYGPLRARGEYQYLDWDANPYRAWRAEFQYIGSVTRSITAYSTLTYLNRHYFGAEPPYTTIDYTEQVVTISGTVTKQLYSYNLYVSLGGSWSHIASLSDGNAWSANSSLVWHIGRFDLSLAVTAYGSDSQSGSNPSFERDHQLISVNLRRQLL